MSQKYIPLYMAEIMDVKTEVRNHMGKAKVNDLVP